MTDLLGLLHMPQPAPRGGVAGRGLHDTPRAALETVMNGGGANPAEVTLAYLKQCTDDFSEDRWLGEGAYGKVYRGVDAASGRVFAVKRLAGGLARDGQHPGVPDDPAELEAMQRSARREIEVLSRFSNPHIVRLLGYTPPSADNAAGPGRVWGVYWGAMPLCPYDPMPMPVCPYVSHHVIDTHFAPSLLGVDWHPMTWRTLSARPEL
jgi:hypothetical protein